MFVNFNFSPGWGSWNGVWLGGAGGEGVPWTLAPNITPGLQGAASAPSLCEVSRAPSSPRATGSCPASLRHLSFPPASLRSWVAFPARPSLEVGWGLCVWGGDSQAEKSRVSCSHGATHGPGEDSNIGPPLSRTSRGPRGFSSHFQSDLSPLQRTISVRGC